MPRKRKRRMKLPNGFGSIKYLGVGRRNPYAVYPPVTEWSPKGPVTPPALDYVETWEAGYELLTAYNLEKQGKIKVNRNVYIDRSPTFAEVYEQYYNDKYNNPTRKKKYSKSAMNSTKSAFGNCSVLHDMKMGQIKYDDLQNVVNECPLKHASLELIVTLYHQMYKYALKHEIVDKDYSKFVYIPIEDDDESGEPFTPEELAVLWENKEDPVCEMLLIMCYSGYRISAFTNMEIHLEEAYFMGGVKTKSSKERSVPIHSGIYAFVERRLRQPKYNGKNLLLCSPVRFRILMHAKLEELGIAYANDKKHTPHDCRHTFSWLCEHYKVSENDRKRMLGHSFGNDITNAVYGHRTVEELREEIEKIKIPYLKG